MTDLVTQGQSPPTQTRPPRKAAKGRSQIATTGNSQLDATIAQAKTVVTSISGVAAEVWAAVPAAIDAEIDIQLEGRLPGIQQQTDKRIAEQSAAIGDVIAANRSKADEFLAKYGVV